MIHIIKHNAGATGRLVLLGKKSDILIEYRWLTRVLCDKYNPDVFINVLADVAHDDISGLVIQEHITEGVENE